jgi:cold shock CspA family protein
MQGTIYSPTLLGYAFVVANEKDVFFLHYSNIKKGAHLIAVGQTVTFDVAPPLPGKRYPQAINAVVGDDTTSASPKSEGVRS